MEVFAILWVGNFFNYLNLRSMKNSLNCKMRTIANNSIVPVIVLLIVITTLFSACSSPEKKESKSENKGDIVIGLNAYSFADLLDARNSRDKQQVYTLFNLLDWCASQNIKALSHWLKK